MATLEDVKAIIEEQGEAWGEFKTANENRLERLEDNAKAIEDFMAKMTAPGGGSFTMGKQEKDSFSVKITDGSIVPVLGKSVNCADFFTKSRDEEFSIGEYAKNVMLGTKAASNSALVPVGVSSQVIDNVRAQTTVIQARAGTIIIDGPTNLAKITVYPTVYEHAEAVSDITESDVTVVPVTLNPKSLVALVSLNMEVVADSHNLNSVLNTSLAAAFGAKLDALALATIFADTNIPTNATGKDAAIWLKCLEAIGLAMTANQPIPTSMIGNSADFISRASQLASTAGSWLGKPPSTGRND